MNIRYLIAALLLSLSLGSAAQITTVQLAHEVLLSDLRLPQSEAGTVGYKSCAECPPESRRVGADTRWLVNGRNLPLDDFRLALARITERSEVYVTVLHHLEQDRVTEVSVYLP